MASSIALRRLASGILRPCSIVLVAPVASTRSFHTNVIALCSHHQNSTSPSQLASSELDFIESPEKNLGKLSTPLCITAQPEFAMLNKYGVDLTKMVLEDGVNPVTGAAWEKEIELVMRILCKKRKNNPCLLGVPGIGVTSVVKALASRIANGFAPPRFEGKKIIALKKCNLLCASENQLQQTLMKLIGEVKQTEGKVILFVDEVDILKHIGAVVDQCIGVLTHDQYEDHIEDDSSLNERFQAVDLPELSTEKIIELLKVWQVTYEDHHNVKYSEDALIAAANLSRKSPGDGSHFDKAIDIIDEIGAQVSLCKKNEVVREDVEKFRMVSSQQEKFPDQILKVSPKKSSALLVLEKSIHKHVIGQEEAVESVCRAILRAQVGIRDPRRPIASFMFTGTTGVGKTELAKAVAIEHFGSIKSMIRLDMSEYTEDHFVSKLIGSPPGYCGYEAGGQLTNAIKKNPKSIILLDEIEKAHEDVHDLLLQILEDGRLTDGKGKTIDFTNTIIVLTSNIGQEVINEAYTRGKDDHPNLKSQVKGELRERFRLEILNRLDDIIVFRPLTNHDDLQKILEIMLHDLKERLTKKKIKLGISDSLKNKLIEEGCDPVFGARPLRRLITKFIEDALVQWISDGDVKEKDLLEIDMDNQGNIIRKTSCVPRNHGKVSVYRPTAIPTVP